MVDIASFIANNFRGPNLPAIDQARRQNALGQIDLQQAQQQQALMSNPSATPEQLVRGGLPQQAAGLENIATQDQQRKAQSALKFTQFTSALAQSQNPKRLGSMMVAHPATAQILNDIGVPADQFAQFINESDDATIKRTAMDLAKAFGARDQGYTLGKDQTRFDSLGNPVAQGPADSDVQFHDTGGSLVPTYKTGQPATGVAPIQKTATPAQQYNPGTAKDAALMIYKGQMPMLTALALRTPYGQEVVSEIKKLSDQGEAAGGNQYNAADFQSRSKAIRDFNTGQQGNSVRFMNVAVSHIGVLEELGKALDNSDVKAFNAFKNRWKTETGQSAPTSFTAARDIVANEVVKAVTASGGSLADRQEAQAQISSASSWGQIADVAQTWKSLLAGQLGGLRQQYEQGTGLKDFNKKLYPETLRELGGLDKTQGGGGGLPAGVTEDDITETMRANNMTRDQVLQRLNAR